MLTEKEIQENKKMFTDLLKSINVDGADMDGLLEYLENSDFFTAPASTVFHSAFKGGLCQHSLNVFYELQELYAKYKEQGIVPEYSEDSLKVVALFHDISKVDFYESYVQNKKIYSDNGSKSDNMGKFDWFSEEKYKVKDAADRFVGADHGTNSYMILSRYIPLTEEEAFAIMNHHCGFDSGFVNRDLSAILNRYPLAVLLHISDFIATYLWERI